MEGLSSFLVDIGLKEGDIIFHVRQGWAVTQAQAAEIQYDKIHLFLH